MANLLKIWLSEFHYARTHLLIGYAVRARLRSMQVCPNITRFRQEIVDTFRLSLISFRHDAFWSYQILTTMPTKRIQWTFRNLEIVEGALWTIIDGLIEFFSAWLTSLWVTKCFLDVHRPSIDFLGSSMDFHRLCPILRSSNTHSFSPFALMIDPSKEKWGSEIYFLPLGKTNSENYRKLPKGAHVALAACRSL